MRALVIGGDGTVGRALGAALVRRGDHVFATTRHADRAHAEGRPLLDLAEPEVSNLPTAEVAFLCAALTRYAVCRNQPDFAHRINVDNTVVLARALLDRGARLIFLSTSAVFNGRAPQRRADAATSPVSEYGRTKAAAETALSALGGAVTIVRLTKVLVPGFPLFAGWCDALARGSPIGAFADMRLAPVGIDHVTVALAAIVDSGAGGIFQVSATRDITYLEAAQHLARRLSAPAELVHSKMAAAQSIPAEERPDFTSMDASRLAELTGLPVLDPFAGIDESMAAHIVAMPVKRELA